MINFSFHFYFWLKYFWFSDTRYIAIWDHCLFGYLTPLSLCNVLLHPRGRRVFFSPQQQQAVSVCCLLRPHSSLSFCSTQEMQGKKLGKGSSFSHTGCPSPLPASTSRILSPDSHQACPLRLVEKHLQEFPLYLWLPLPFSRLNTVIPSHLATVNHSLVVLAESFLPGRLAALALGEEVLLSHLWSQLVTGISLPWTELVLIG